MRCFVRGLNLLLTPDNQPIHTNHLATVAVTSMEKATVSVAAVTVAAVAMAEHDDSAVSAVSAVTISATVAVSAVTVSQKVTARVQLVHMMDCLHEEARAMYSPHIVSVSVSVAVTTVTVAPVSVSSISVTTERQAQDGAEEGDYNLGKSKHCRLSHERHTYSIVQSPINSLSHVVPTIIWKRGQAPDLAQSRN